MKAARITIDQRALLFTHPSLLQSDFPLLSRLAECAEVIFASSELEALIIEIERATVLPNLSSSVRLFFGPFHTACCVAWARDEQIEVRLDCVGIDEPTGRISIS